MGILYYAATSCAGVKVHADRKAMIPVKYHVKERNMKLKTIVNGKVYQFKDVKDVLAKANEPKAGDRLQKIAASDETERVAAKVVLSEMLVEDLVENPTVSYEKD